MRVNPIRNLSLRTAALPLLAPTLLCTVLTASAPVDLGECPPSFNQTTYTCCYDDVTNQPELCVTQVSVTGASGPNCEPCHFTFSAFVTCIACGTLSVSGESGISCVSRETHFIPCPDGLSDALFIQFICGHCEANPEEN